MNLITNLTIFLLFPIILFSCKEKGSDRSVVDGKSVVDEKSVVDQKIEVPREEFEVQYQIVLGASTTCVLSQASGSVKYWDRIPTGEAAIDSGIQEIIFTAAEAEEEVAKVEQLAVGEKHICILMDNEKVKCWGGNKAGQLGKFEKDLEDVSSDKSAYVDFGNELKVKQIATGHSSFHTCAILDNDKVKCWGNNNKGQLGIKDQAGVVDIQNRGDEKDEMGDKLPFADLGEDNLAKKIAVGDHHTCAILQNDKVKCWGSNDYEQLGINSGDGYVDFGDRHAMELSLGFDKSCALLNDGSVKCWGSNGMGFLGQSKEDSSVNLGAGVKVRQISVGHTHICALLDDYKIKCWGSNDNGELGKANEMAVESLAQMGEQLPTVDLGEDAIQISLGYKRSCAVLANQKIKCWGFDNKEDQMGVASIRGIVDEEDEMGDNFRDVDLGNW